MAESTPPTDPATFAQRWLTAPKVFIQLTVVVLVAATFTLLRVEQSVTPPPIADDPTPLGYTWSLLLFVLPLTYLIVGFLLHPQYKVQRKAFTVTMAILLPTGFLLDLFFANARRRPRRALTPMRRTATRGTVTRGAATRWFSRSFSTARP
ncbi:MAG: hypothetical protein AAGE94_14370 [Acidobacteriota bacterium]